MEAVQFTGLEEVNDNPHHYGSFHCSFAKNMKWDYRSLDEYCLIFLVGSALGVLSSQSTGACTVRRVHLSVVYTLRTPSHVLYHVSKSRNHIS